MHSLHTAAWATIPCKKVDYYKVWWDTELDNLKTLSMYAHSVWKQAGKPKSGPVYDAKRISHANYKLAIKCLRMNYMSVYLVKTLYLSGKPGKVSLAVRNLQRLLKD